MCSDCQVFYHHEGTCRSYALRLLLNHVSQLITPSVFFNTLQTCINIASIIRILLTNELQAQQLLHHHPSSLADCL